jgi:hypothetical protein
MDTGESVAAANQAQIAAQMHERMQQTDNHDGFWRVAGGVGLAATAVVMGGVIAWGQGHADERIKYTAPFSEVAQSVMSNADNGLADAGKILVPGSLLGLGVLKLAGRRNTEAGRKARSLDHDSSSEPSGDGDERASIARRVMHRGSSIAMVATTLGSFTAGIGTEVTQGPDRPIDALEAVAPGDAMIVQYPGAMPMVQSSVNPELTQAVRAAAAKRHVQTHSLALNLGTISYKDKTNTDLALGIEMAPDSPAKFNLAKGCSWLPVEVDKSANIPTGSKVEVNGMSAEVVGHVENTSAMNRTGVVIDKEALGTCLEQSANAPDHAEILNTDTQTANEILTEANANLHDQAVVISKERYLKNSEGFWESNVKPITNVLAGVSGLMALVSMAGITMSRLLRNRREWAAQLAAGVSRGHMGATEVVRSVKEGVVAATVGVTAAGVLTPLADVVVPGFQAAMGFQEAMVGAGLAIGGSLVGSLVTAVRSRRAVDTEKHTRL